jgi:hypothetical protein
MDRHSTIENSQTLFAEVVVNEATGQHALHSSAFFEKDQVVTTFSASNIFDEPNYLTIQLNDEQHIALEPQCLQYTNHSCEPNVFFDTTNMLLIALRDIKPGEEFSFFYPSTEFNMARPFTCLCQTENCLKEISGAFHLSNNELKKYRLTDFILKKLSIQ